MLNPKPKHLGQAPNGELKEKKRGVSSSMAMSQSGQAYFVEYRVTSSPFTHSTNPSESLSAASKLSVRRRVMPCFITSLSTTTEMVCFIFLSKSTSAPPSS